MQYGVYMPLWDVSIEALMLRNGTAMTRNGGTEFALAEPAGYEVVQAIADAMNVHHVMPTPITADSLPGGVVSLQTGKYAMVIGGGGARHKLVHITVPLLTPTIFFNLIMALIG